MALEELGIPGEVVDAFKMAVCEEAFVLEDVAQELGLSDSEARFILKYLIDSKIMEFKQVWVPIKKMAES
ncbi:hypothetical protein [Pedobacter sp. P26]|uniref:hypothetical protein n=1 Tax=Pedobacter sp. P26 TaxID=3423956 RepID=UPI003D66AAE6